MSEPLATVETVAPGSARGEAVTGAGHSEQASGPVPDESARRRVALDLDATLFVEAGAGSGKTTALVDRVLSLVTSGTASLSHIAAITFTEKAAAELRDRIRQSLERAVRTAAGSETAERCSVALDQLDNAPIGTLHAFAQRVLSEHPIEAGLPPHLEVLDEVSSGIEFEARWSDFRDRLLDDPALERTLLLWDACGVKDDGLRILAKAFNQNWDLVDDRVPPAAPDPPDVRQLVERALPWLDAVCRQASACTDSDDKLLKRLDEMASYAQSLRGVTDELDLLGMLRSDVTDTRPSFKVGTVGIRGSWNLDLGSFKAQIADAAAHLDVAVSEVAAACARRLGSALRAFTLDSANARRRSGTLEFHDLLVLARSLLRHPDHGPAVRTRLAERYPRLLLDEFQDTDPIQIELAVRIAATAPAVSAAGDWGEVKVRPGALFFVGDPKQSIYRFRRADISLFLKAKKLFGDQNGGAVELTSNFRTVPAVIDWVNATFASLFGEAPAIDVPVQSQPNYLALQAVRAGPPAGPAVAVLGRNPHPLKTSADTIRTAEADEVAVAIASVIDGGWSVDDGKGGWRPARLGDITVLVPARTSLPFLETALERERIAFRAESSSLVYATRAVRDLLMVLRAVNDPTDNLRIVGALRTPYLGCGDDDLFRFGYERRGRWNYLAGQPDSVPADDLVRVGLGELRRWHHQRAWKTPSELLAMVVADRRVMELGFTERRPRDVWRRVRFVIDQARAWHSVSDGSLRQYLQWVDLQAVEGNRLVEPVLPEPDDDAVRIMTIHAAKGLEFPITIVSGMSTVPQTRATSAQVVFPSNTSEPGYRFGKYVTTPEFEAWAPIDEQMLSDERVRLLYVATTRARDHLIVSLHRKERATEAPLNKRTNAELLLDGMQRRIDDFSDAAEPNATIPAGVDHPVAPLAPEVEWASQLREALEISSRPTTVAATAPTDEGTHDADDEPEDGPDDGLEKRPRDLDLPPWLKGRYGSAVGRAVHGVLQTIDLATGKGLKAAVAAQCEAEAIPDQANAVTRLVTFALSSSSVQEAARSPHWREVYACAPLPDGRLLEGYIDLLYRGPEGLVVVDYKTSSSSDPTDLDRRVEGYRLQGESYAVAVGQAAGESVSRVTFIFLTRNGFVERSLDRLG